MDAEDGRPMKDALIGREELRSDDGLEIGRQGEGQNIKVGEKISQGQIGSV